MGWEKLRKGPGGSDERRVQFMVLCLLWYLSSALTSNTSKTILNTVQRPITLTFVQFGMISGWCLLTTMVWWVVVAAAAARGGGGKRKSRGMRIMVPSRRILTTTLPMCGFQIAGHVFGSMATSKVPVSVVHTVKALSPLFTVLAYRVVFGVRYSPSTYASLLPLTLGVMLACSLELSANVSGLVCALGSCLVFVSQNIFTKKLVFTDESAGGWWSTTSGPKPDKINIMFYSSGMAFVLMTPMWLYETVPSGGDVVVVVAAAAAATHQQQQQQPSVQSILALYLFNGTAHFAQNVIAFTILSIASPVAYSIAGLVKRIFVIVMSIMWFGQPTTLVQALGIVMTFAGLYLYDRAREDVARGERKVERIEMAKHQLLPLDTKSAAELARVHSPTISTSSAVEQHPSTTIHQLNSSLPSPTQTHPRARAGSLSLKPQAPLHPPPPPVTTTNNYVTNGVNHTTTYPPNSKYPNNHHSVKRHLSMSETIPIPLSTSPTSQLEQSVLINL